MELLWVREVLDLSAVGLVYEDVLECIVTPADGRSTGEAQSVSTMLSNTPPTVTEVSLEPASVTEDDIFTCTALGYEDADGHTSIDYQYGWIVDGVDLGVSDDSLTGEFFDKNQEVLCYAMATDGYDFGDTTSSSGIVVENDIPLIAGIKQATPTSVNSASELTCGYVGYSDSDPMDTDQSIIEWYSGGIKVGEGVFLTLKPLH